MQRLIRFADALASPAILIVVVWCAMLALVAAGPIDYPRQPSLAVLATVGIGVLLFLFGYRGGRLLFDSWFARQRELPAPSARELNRVVLVSALVGIVGIGLVALDRMILSGVNNSGYATLLRCAPELVETIAIRRTALLYLGYVMFSFGFVSVILFLLHGEIVRGWAAALAQVSIICPVGYALLYSGRMPILFIVVLVIAAMLVRVSQGRPPLPPGQYLLLKTIVGIGLFAVYTSSTWSSRESFCVQVAPLVKELQQENQLREAASAEASPENRPKPAEAMTATDLSKRLSDTTAVQPPAPQTTSADAALAMMKEAWNVKPRGYVTSALDAGYLSPGGVMSGLRSYFYLTHGVRTIDLAWHAREGFSRHWGLYEVGVLSPILRVFVPDNQQLAAMETEQRASGIYGFYPTVWLAAFIDFGFVGAIIYILIWGFVAGWSAAAAKRSSLITPRLVLVFVLVSILLSPIQGPLGIANSALVLISMLVVGLVVDMRMKFARAAGAEN